jgi:hypothetical protein
MITFMCATGISVDHLVFAATLIVALAHMGNIPSNTAAVNSNSNTSETHEGRDPKLVDAGVTNTTVFCPHPAIETITDDISTDSGNTKANIPKGPLVVDETEERRAAEPYPPFKRASLHLPLQAGITHG